MASTSETGHATNVANFEDLISFCTGYGAAYNPSKAALQLTALNQQLAAAQAALQAVKTAKTAYDNATNAREIAFKPLKPLCTKIINALAATDAVQQTIDDARTILNKIQGRRAKAVEVPDAAALAAGTEPVKTSSTSQQSFDKLIDHTQQLAELLTAEPNYLPNENELKTATLSAMLTDLRARNTSVINAVTAVSNARIARDQVLYGETTGVTDTAMAIKQYVKSIFGATSPQFKQVSGLRFNKKAAD